MIAGIFHEGSGLGNQLHRYVATRVLALDKGYEWTMIQPKNFKGSSFMNLKLLSGTPELGILGTELPFIEKQVVENGVDIRGYDPEINFVEDNTIIDGEFQDPRYFEHRMDEINSWLAVESIEIPDDTCVIGFRGGEYTLYPDLFLGQQYWGAVINNFKVRNPGVTKFEVHTDDPVTAQQIFPNFPIINNMATNWRSMRCAKYALIANSSFYILPRLLKHHEDKEAFTLAPRYWARHNTETWALPQNFYKQFTYL